MKEIRTRRARSNKILYGSAVGAAFIASFAISAAASASSGQQSSDPSQPLGTTVADYDVAALTASSTAQDVLPAEVVDSDFGATVDASTVRAVGSHDGAQYYAATDDRGYLCLISFTPGESWVFGASCSTPDSFASGGTGVQVSGPDTFVEGYLVPDDAPQIGQPLTQISTNLYVVDPATSAATLERNAAVDSSDASGFSLRMVEGRGSDE